MLSFRRFVGSLTVGRKHSGAPFDERLTILETRRHGAMIVEYGYSTTNSVLLFSTNRQMNRMPLTTTLSYLTSDHVAAIDCDVVRPAPSPTAQKIRPSHGELRT